MLQVVLYTKFFYENCHQFGQFFGKVLVKSLFGLLFLYIYLLSCDSVISVDSVVKVSNIHQCPLSVRQVKNLCKSYSACSLTSMNVLRMTFKFVSIQGGQKISNCPRIKYLFQRDTENVIWNTWPPILIFNLSRTV